MKTCLIAPAQSTHTQRWVNFYLGSNLDVFVISAEDYEIPGVKVYLLKRNTSKGKNRTNKRFSFKNIIKKIAYNRALNQLYFIRGLWFLYRESRYRDKIKRIIRKEKPDIVHAFESIPFGFYGAKQDFEVPFLVSIWGSDIVQFPKKSFIFRNATKKILKKAKVIFCTSRFLGRKVKNYLSKSDYAKIKIVPFGIDIERFNPEKFTKDKDRVFTLGFIKHFKEIYAPGDVVKAFSLVSKKIPDSHLIMIGDGDLKDELKRLVKKLKLQDKVELLDYIPYEKVPSYLSKMDVFLMPSLHDSFGVSAIEAQAMQVPVVATNVEGIPEAIQDKKTGFLVPVHSPEKIAEKVLLLARNRNLRLKMGERGREFVKENYVWERNAGVVLKVYEEIIS